MLEVIDVLVKALLGGSVIAGIVLLNQYLGSKAAAVLSFAPIFTILGLLFVNQDNQGQSSLSITHEYIIGLLITAPVLIVFCLAVYYLISRTSLAKTITLSLLIWLILTSLSIYFLN